MLYRPDIDGLRAVAIIPVVLFHAFPALMPGGFIGVDIFFVISGYLISGVILSALERGKFTFRHFYSRRVLRIFPALALVLFCCLAGGWLLLKPGEFMALGKHVLGGAGFVANILLYTETGYFDGAAHAKPLLNLWSLGIEEQFYLAFPLLLWLCWRYFRRIAPVLALLCVLSFADNLWLAQKHPSADFYLPLSRFWELLAGAFLQAAQRTAGQGGRPRFLTRGLCNLPAALCGGALVIAALCLCEHAESSYPGYMGLLPVAGAFLLIAAGPENALNRLLLASRPAVSIGKISYTLYLWHWPLLSFAYIHYGAASYESASGLRAGLVLAAFLLATATWLFVEIPVRYGNFLGRAKIGVLLGSMVFVAALGLLVWLSGGFIPYLNDHNRAIYELLREPPEKDEAGLARTGTRFGELDICRFHDAKSGETLAIIGDSHAQAAFPGVAELGGELGFNTLLLGRFPVWTHYRDNTRQPQLMLDILRKEKDIKTVLFIIRGATYVSEAPNPGDRKKDPIPHMREERLYRETADFLRQIVGLGKKVIIVEDNPDLDIDVRDAIYPGLEVNPIKEDYRATPRQEALKRQRPWLAMLAKLEKIPGVSVVRGTFDEFCPGPDCLVFDKEGLPLYFDDDHLSIAGSRRLAQKVIRPHLERRSQPPRGEAQD